MLCKIPADIHTNYAIISSMKIKKALLAGLVLSLTGILLIPASAHGQSYGATGSAGLLGQTPANNMQGSSLQESTKASINDYGTGNASLLQQPQANLMVFGPPSATTQVSAKVKPDIKYFWILTVIASLFLIALLGYLYKNWVTMVTDEPIESQNVIDTHATEETALAEINAPLEPPKPKKTKSKAKKPRNKSRKKKNKH